MKRQISRHILRRLNNTTAIAAARRPGNIRRPVGHCADCRKAALARTEFFGRILVNGCSRTGSVTCSGNSLVPIAPVNEYFQARSRYPRSLLVHGARAVVLDGCHPRQTSTTNGSIGFGSGAVSTAPRWRLLTRMSSCFARRHRIAPLFEGAREIARQGRNELHRSEGTKSLTFVEAL